jgi:uncharacterized membrane protein YgaE (UPF0421/DUF939 family)
LVDFTNLDPHIIAQFWIYIIASFFGGCCIGWLVTSSFLKRESNILDSERKQFAAEKERLALEKASFFEKKEEYESIKTKYESLHKEHESLRKELEMNKEYWLYKKRNLGPYDVDPSVLLQNGLKKQ